MRLLNRDPRRGEGTPLDLLEYETVCASAPERERNVLVLELRMNCELFELNCCFFLRRGFKCVLADYAIAPQRGNSNYIVHILSFLNYFTLILYELSLKKSTVNSGSSFRRYAPCALVRKESGGEGNARGETA